MPRASLRRAAIVGVGVALVAGLPDPGAGLDCRSARAAEDPPRVAIAAEAEASRSSPLVRPFPPRSVGRRGEEHPEGTGGWWLGTAGIALALAVCGGISLATRRGWTPVTSGGPLRVVGRIGLSPRHTVYLLRVGRDRVLIVGTGSQGAPSLLGELNEGEEAERFGVQETASASPGAVNPTLAAVRALFDRLVAAWRPPAEENR